MSYMRLNERALPRRAYARFSICQPGQPGEYSFAQVSAQNRGANLGHPADPMPGLVSAMVIYRQQSLRNLANSCVPIDMPISQT